MVALASLLAAGWRVEVVMVGALASVTIRHVACGTYNVAHENVETALRMAAAGDCRRIEDGAV